MPALKHLVIFLYTAELIALSMLFTHRFDSGGRIREQPVASLCAAIFIRILVRMIYFYVEFYILPWRLNILFNALMDIAYVLSIGLSFAVSCMSVLIGFPHRRLFSVASIVYVAGLALVSFLWVDPASNFDIHIAEGAPQVLAIAVEVFFLVTVFVIAFEVERGGSTKTPSRILLAVTCLYAAYVFIWDLSLFVPFLSGIHIIRPFDGVLCFGAAIIALLPRYFSGQEAKQGQGASPHSPASMDFGSFAQEYGLTARETEVLELLSQGLNTTEVAERLVVSANTVRRHVYNIYRKAGVSNRYELLYKLSGR